MKTDELTNKTVLVTGAAGFIGANLCRSLLKNENCKLVVGLDSLIDYYDPNKKVYRLSLI